MALTQVDNIPEGLRTHGKTKILLDEFIKSGWAFARCDDTNIKNLTYLNITAKRFNLPVRAMQRSDKLYLARTDKN